MGSSISYEKLPEAITSGVSCFRIIKTKKFQEFTEFYADNGWIIKYGGETVKSDYTFINKWKSRYSKLFPDTIDFKIKDGMYYHTVYDDWRLYDGENFSIKLLQFLLQFHSERGTNPYQVYTNIIDTDNFMKTRYLYRFNGDSYVKKYVSNDLESLMFTIMALHRTVPIKDDEALSFKQNYLKSSLYTDQSTNYLAFRGLFSLINEKASLEDLKRYYITNNTQTYDSEGRYVTDFTDPRFSTKTYWNSTCKTYWGNGEKTQNHYVFDADNIPKFLLKKETTPRFVWVNKDFNNRYYVRYIMNDMIFFCWNWEALSQMFCRFMS